MCQTKSYSSRETFQQLLLVLGIDSKGIDVLLDVALGGIEVIFAPIGTENSCSLTPGPSPKERGVMDDALEFALHHPLIL